MRSARFVAADVLRRYDPRLHPITEKLRQRLRDTDQRQRCTDLVLGTLRHQTALDRVVEHFAGCPVKRIAKPLRSLIRIAVYELVFCEKTPVYSIVNEAAEITRTRMGAKQVGFVNAVLRQVSRHIKCRSVSPPFLNPCATLIQDMDHGCEFDQVFLPDPQDQASQYLHQCFSLPQWLIDCWLAEFGYTVTLDICLGSVRRPSVYLRPNPLKISVQALADHLIETGLDAHCCAAGLIRLTGAGDISQLPGFEQGWFSVQDLAAFQVGLLLNPAENTRILDMCAAPGGKTTHLAELTRNHATIFATDINRDRLSRVSENADRLGLDAIRIVDYQQLQSCVQEQGLFDVILLDVPCSNTGVLAKRVEVRFRCNPQSVKSCAQTQMQLLKDADAMLKPGGRICYSTCSILRAENQDRVGRFLAGAPRFLLEEEKLTLPTARMPDSDGGYVAIMLAR
jgi:16S rRNA (cytosine967-C5)-methyltransferase